MRFDEPAATTPRATLPNPATSPLPGKDLLSSRAFWGVALLVISQLLARYGYSIPDKALFIDNAIAAVDILGQMLGVALSLWGTIKRDQPIRSVLGMRVH